MSHEFVVGRLYIQQESCVYLLVGAEHVWLFSYPCVFNNVYQLAIVETSGQHNPLVFLDDSWYRFCQVYTYELCQCWCVCGIFNIMFGSLDICRSCLHGGLVPAAWLISHNRVDRIPAIYRTPVAPATELSCVSYMQPGILHSCLCLQFDTCVSQTSIQCISNGHPALLSEVPTTFALPAWTCSGTRM